jgi:predicted transcriptional regulator of viral defense system
MLKAGEFERIGRGVFIRPDVIDPALAALAAASLLQPRTTLCLTSALVYHGLSDAVPADCDIALPRRTRFPAGFAHVAWHRFDIATFDVGRIRLEADSDLPLFVYSAERTLVDHFRLAHQEGSNVANVALKRWLRAPGHHATSLLVVAAHFPRVLSRLRRTLEILL